MMDQLNCSYCEEFIQHCITCVDTMSGGVGGGSSGRRHLSVAEDARTWSKGLNYLLESSYGTALFRAFLQRDYAEENLDFILKVRQYRDCDSPQKRAKMAWKLYKNYVAIGAPHELNLDMLSRKVTDLAIITPHISTFDSAYKRILNLLENDAFMRFLDWDVYKQLLADEEERLLTQQQQQQQAEPSHNS